MQHFITREADFVLLVNGLIAAEEGAYRADIRMHGEIIEEIGASLGAREGEQVIDAAGKIIMPGGVDVHTHMDLELGPLRATDDFYTGTLAAAFGGTTTIVDHMAFGLRGCTIRRQVERYHRLAESKAVVDYGFHGVFDHVDDAILLEVVALSREGITSHKFYLTYGGRLEDSEILRLMEVTAGIGVILAVHAENDAMIRHLRAKYLAQGKTAPIYHARSRPPECEAEAIGRMALFAAVAGDAPLYIVHLSSGLGLDVLRGLRRRGQKHLFIETCPQYLFLDESAYLREDGLKFIMSPPLREEQDCHALNQGIHDGDIDVVGTDHCPFFFSREKQLGLHDFSKAPGGVPGVEARIPLLFSQVRAGRLTLEKMVSVCCGNPARLFGMYPRKGVIAVGSDADIAVIDPDIKKTLTFDMLHENTDYTPYEGMPLAGYPVLTISRGEIIVADGKFTGQKGRGKFLKRGLPDLRGRQ